MSTAKPASLRHLWTRVPLAMVLLLVSTTVHAGSAPEGSAARSLPEDQKILHALNRLGFGARPGDVERVRAMGLDDYIRQQLDPTKIDDKACEKAVEPLDTLKMSSEHFMGQFFEDIKFFLQMQMASGNADDMKMRFGVDLPNDKKALSKDNPYQQNGLPNLGALAKRDSIRCMAELQQAKLMRAALSERQLQEVMVDFWSNHFNVDMRKNACRALIVAHDRDVIRTNALGKFHDLLSAVAHSPAMLAYLDNNENSVARERGAIETKLIEWYVSYKFGYSVKGQISNKEGPNENYGRELLELHTLGVDGGYTQKDVQEVARCFSGWSYSGMGGKFEFNKNRHDQGEKTVLGVRLPKDHGIKDGEDVLKLLSRHPSTAKFISRKLCQRFVSDEPPTELVERVAKVFTGTGGDIRKVIESIVNSDAFYAPTAVRSKIKSPFEYAVSAVRATGGEFTGRGWGMFGKLSYIEEGGALLGNDPKLSKEKKKSLNWHVHDMGQPLLAFAAPTGYPELSSKWVSPSALIDRLNFAVALTESDMKDIKVDVSRLLGKKVDADNAEAVIERLAATLLHQPLSDATKATLLRSLDVKEGRTIDIKKAAGLILGSPEFQRR
ncbi:DUF1800 domain-containing protein [Humisphaera borealis]|uniref:DUF1800 domain-containing protein n=1 Tax=Humisphaera borealis TaxID=2807512 RepID=A0A7M2WX52_9BACT|nr:DUF1800 domain-containing protein [Humisphaera borealis]QOV90108.1 DUF1800 domain-containing protein [Humisphaera borealis]